MKLLKACVLALLIMFPTLSIHAQETITVRDMAGRSVQVPSRPDRILCLGPGTLRLMVYLRVQHKLAGIEGMEKNLPTGRPYWYANQTLARLPVIGPGGPAAINKDPDVEAVLGVKPQLIFITQMEPSRVEALQRKISIPVVLLSYGKVGSFDSALYDSLRLAGQIMGASMRAEEVIAYAEKSKKDLAARTGKITGERPVVYAGGIGFKGTHGIESTDAEYVPFEWTGARNGAKALGGREHVFADREKLLALNPDVIFLDAAGLPQVLQDYRKRPEYYRAFKAFKKDWVYVLYPYNFYTTNIESVLADSYAVGKVLYSQAFSDVDLKKKTDEIFKFFLGTSVSDQMEKDFGVLGRRLTLPAS